MVQLYILVFQWMKLIKDGNYQGFQILHVSDTRLVSIRF